MNAQDALELIQAIQKGEFEDARLEVKRAQKGLPTHLYEAISAFSNQSEGGVIVLGVDEAHRFTLTGVENVQVVLTELTDLASKMDPPLSLDIQVIDVDQKSIIIAEVPECDFQYRPCYYKPAGMQSGSFLRVGNQSRRMTPYEIYTFIVGRGQPVFDRELVKTAFLSDLDEKQIQTYLERIQKMRSNIWNRLRLGDKDLTDQLLALDVLGQENEEIHPTLAGLLVFGTWPQKVYPSLMISFVRYFGIDSETKGLRGERFQDNAQFEGSLPEVIDQAVTRCITNMKQATLIEGILHRMIPEYPEEALREALVNAIAHRDYSSYVLGSQVRIEMFADRLEIISPGGLFGPVSLTNLETAQSSRNQLLVRLLGEVGLVENRGSGIRAMVSAMREAHLEPPKFEDHHDYFKVIFSNQALLDSESLAWLNQFASISFNSRQRTALAYLHKHEQMTNGEYCRLNSVDSVSATKDLKGLVDSGLVEMHGTRRWAFYQLLNIESRQKTFLNYEESVLNHRQKAVMQYLSQNNKITVSEFIHLTGDTISERTAQRDLNDLEGKKLIVRMGQGKNTQYLLFQK
ncbi:MAG: ATP-binding protein [Bacteroidales bacterium]